jgi:hypothetical protein
LIRLSDVVTATIGVPQQQAKSVQTFEGPINNVEMLTYVLKQIQVEEFVVSAAALDGLVFYQVEHIN